MLTGLILGFTDVTSLALGFTDVTNLVLGFELTTTFLRFLKGKQKQLEVFPYGALLGSR